METGSRTKTKPALRILSLGFVGVLKLERPAVR